MTLSIKSLSTSDPADTSAHVARAVNELRQNPRLRVQAVKDGLFEAVLHVASHVPSADMLEMLFWAFSVYKEDGSIVTDDSLVDAIESCADASSSCVVLVMEAAKKHTHSVTVCEHACAVLETMVLCSPVRIRLVTSNGGVRYFNDVLVNHAESKSVCYSACSALHNIVLAAGRPVVYAVVCTDLVHPLVHVLSTYNASESMCLVVTEFLSTCLSLVCGQCGPTMREYTAALVTAGAVMVMVPIVRTHIASVKVCRDVCRIFGFMAVDRDYGYEAGDVVTCFTRVMETHIENEEKEFD